MSGSGHDGSLVPPPTPAAVSKKKTSTAPFFVFVNQNSNCKVSELVWQREVANLGSMVARIQFQSQLCMSVSHAEGLHSTQWQNFHRISITLAITCESVSGKEGWEFGLHSCEDLPVRAQSFLTS